MMEKKTDMINFGYNNELWILLQAEFCDIDVFLNSIPVSCDNEGRILYNNMQNNTIHNIDINISENALSEERGSTTYVIFESINANQVDDYVLINNSSDDYKKLIRIVYDKNQTEEMYNAENDLFSNNNENSACKNSLLLHNWPILSLFRKLKPLGLFTSK